MRKSLWIMVAILFAAIGAPHAQADTITNYTISFSGTGTLPTSGTFTYDSTTPAFSNFIVVWNGITFDLTSAANSPTIFGPTPPACISGNTGAAASFDLLTNCSGPTTIWQGSTLLPGFTTFSFQTPFTATGCGAPVAPLQNCVLFGDIIMTGFMRPNIVGGTFSTAVITAPEPSSVALMLLGAGLLFVIRKRIGPKLLPTR